MTSSVFVMLGIEFGGEGTEWLVVAQLATDKLVGIVAGPGSRETSPLKVFLLGSIKVRFTSLF